MNRNRLAEFRCRSNTRSYRYWRIVRGATSKLGEEAKTGRFNTFLRRTVLSRITNLMVRN